MSAEDRTYRRCWVVVRDKRMGGETAAGTFNHGFLGGAFDFFKRVVTSLF